MGRLRSKAPAACEIKNGDKVMSCEIERAVLELGGVWPKVDPGRDGIAHGKLYVEYGGMLLKRSRGEWMSGDVVCTHAQFLAKRAELENKPSWDDAPEWAQWLAQDSTGVWYWYKSWPATNSRRFVSSDTLEVASHGHVFGNWQDSLQRRPVELDYEPEDVAFKKEWVPGVGERSEISVLGGDWCRGYLKFYGKELVVFEYEGDRCEVAIQHRSCKFRPIKSHRDQCIEAAMDAGECLGVREVYERLYGAGMLKLPEE